MANERYKGVKMVGENGEVGKVEEGAVGQQRLDSSSPWLIDADYFVPELEIGKNGRHFEVLAWPAGGELRGLVFDLDKCLYGGEQGRGYLKAGADGEIEAIAGE